MKPRQFFVVAFFKHTINSDYPPPRTQAFNDTATGRLSELRVNLSLDSPSMRVMVRGSGPIGQFVATVTNITMSGASMPTSYVYFLLV